MVVDEANHLHTELGPVLDLTGQCLARVACSDDQYPFMFGRLKLRRPEPVAPHADQHADAEKRE